MTTINLDPNNEGMGAACYAVLTIICLIALVAFMAMTSGCASATDMLRVQRTGDRVEVGVAAGGQKAPYDKAKVALAALTAIAAVDRVAENNDWLWHDSVSSDDSASASGPAQNTAGNQAYGDGNTQTYNYYYYHTL